MKFMSTKEFLLKKVSTKKGLIVLLIALFLGSVFVIQETKEGGFLKLITGFIGTQEKAILSLSPASGSYTVGDNFSVNVLVNTKGQNVVVVGAYLNYNPKQLEVVNINTDNSVFGTNYKIVNYNGSASYTPAGKIEIIEAKPSPGVNTNSGLVATINFKALTEISPIQDNLTFDFTAAYAAGDSEIILDDGQGTDILSGVNNGKYIIKTIISKETATIKIVLEGKEDFTTSFKFLAFEPGTNIIVYRVESLSSDKFGENTIEVSLTDLPAGVYDFRVVIPYHLNKRIRNVIWPTNIKIEFTGILAGNLQHIDDEINSLDWSIMNNDWGKRDVPSDINKDGIVNTLDWSFLNKNWLKRGE